MIGKQDRWQEDLFVACPVRELAGWERIADANSCDVDLFEQHSQP